MEQKKQKNKNEGALQLILSNDLEEVKKGIVVLEQNGKLVDLEPILKIYLLSSEKEIKNNLFHLLASVSLKGAEKEWMRIIQNENNSVTIQSMLNILWNTKLNFSPFISDFVKMAVDGDYLTSMECLTIIENLEGPFEEQTILEAQIHLKSHLEKEGTVEEKKAFILSEIAHFIMDQNEALDADLFLD